MSIRLTHDIFCDGKEHSCANWVYTVTLNHSNFSKARKELKKKGWIHYKGRDLCPDCSCKIANSLT